MTQRKILNRVSVFVFAIFLVGPTHFLNAESSKNGLFPEEIISIQDLRAKQTQNNKFLLLDVRGKDTYDTAHIKGAVLPLSEEYYKAEELFRFGLVKEAPDREKDLAAAMKKYPKNMPIVAYCNDHCSASAVLVLKLKELGYTHVRAMEPGIQSWQTAGYPVVSSAKNS